MDIINNSNHSYGKQLQEDIYAGISILKLPIDSIDFGHGILLSKTFIHVFGPYMAAFKEPEKGKPHPAPWKAVGGGLAFDIHTELFIPQSLSLFKNIDRLNTVWLIAALMRLKVLPFINIPVISNKKFSIIAQYETEATFHPIETNSYNLFYSHDKKDFEINLEDFEWVKHVLSDVGKLYEQNNKYALALLSLDRAISENRFSLALMTLWGALEQIFSPDDKQELSYRLSLNIASYLEPRGEQRALTFKKIRKLYNARSKAAHGNPTEDSVEFFETYEILKKVFIKMTETKFVPSQSDFEKEILVN